MLDLQCNSNTLTQERDQTVHEAEQAKAEGAKLRRADEQATELRKMAELTTK